MAQKENLDAVLHTIPSNIDPTIANQLAQLQLKRLLREEKELEEKEIRNQQAKQAGIDSMVKQREYELAKQTQCNHKNEFGKTALAGQRLNSGKYLYLCQQCSKEFHGGAVPADLAIPSDRVGGPNY